MNELILAIDTATPAGSVAMIQGETLLGEVLLNLSSTHSERLLTAADQLLKETGHTMADLAALAVVRGPGSFTGIRVGMGTVQGLALATGCPVIPVSSLQSVALNAAASSETVWSLLDARKGEVYAGAYRIVNGLPVTAVDEQVASIDSVLDQVQGPSVFVGPGAQVYRDAIEAACGDQARFLPSAANLPRATMCALLALHEYRQQGGVAPYELSPVYLRKSEAEIARERQS